MGIVFTGGEGPPPDLVKGLLDGAAKGALTAAADSGLALAEAAGCRPDWIIGDMDSLDNNTPCRGTRLDSYPAEKVLRHRADKDYTDTELALSLLWEQGCDEAWILGGGGGRADHFFAIRSLFERGRFPRRWITGGEDIRCIDTGENLTLRLEPGALVSVFPLGAGAWRAASRGLQWPLDPLVWDRGFFGVSNVAVDGIFSILAEQGRFMVIMPGLPPA